MDYDVRFIVRNSCRFALVGSIIWQPKLRDLLLLILVPGSYMVIQVYYYYYYCCYYYYWKFQQRLMSLVKKRTDVVTEASALRTARSGTCCVASWQSKIWYKGWFFLTNKDTKIKYVSLRYHSDFLVSDSTIRRIEKKPPSILYNSCLAVSTLPCHSRTLFLNTGCFRSGQANMRQERQRVDIRKASQVYATENAM